MQPSENAYVLFDDTVLDKRHSISIDLARRQYSGNEHRVIRGIGLTLLRVRQSGNGAVLGETTIDSMTPMAMGFSLLDHVAAMLNGVVYSAVFWGE